MTKAFFSRIHRLTGRLAGAPDHPTANTVTVSGYARSAPSVRNALDIFAGEWTSRLPPPFDGLTTGYALLFEDPRIANALRSVGGVQGRRVLELGPLEAGHTYMLDRAGAAEIISIEGNTRAFLKCLVTKEVLAIPSARFLCGDFTEYLRAANERFDVVIASGVLYHMVNPVALIEDLSRVTDRLFIWTHYYDRDLLDNERNRYRIVPPTEARHAGFQHSLYRNDYGRSVEQAAFCGGSAPHSFWMTREGILGALRHFGFSNLETADEQKDHTHGPAFSVIAQR